ncbi:hypothetical protein J6590_017650 [Homalodisca vitripennis]|nr:hypothetical protein J6590_017650 [Homalodisca vitripennis]
MKITVSKVVHTLVPPRRASGVVAFESLTGGRVGGVGMSRRFGCFRRYSASFALPPLSIITRFITSIISNPAL